MSVPAFGSKFAVERLDVGIVSGLSWPRDVQCGASLVCPDVHVPGHKLASIAPREEALSEVMATRAAPK